MKKHQTGIQLPSSVLIDPTHEPLREILPFYRGITHVPSEIDGPALMVFIELNKCFDKAGKVCEGLLGNVIWGLEQVGYDAKHIAAGLSKLRDRGYIFYSYQNGERIPELCIAPITPMWIRYTQKFQDLLVKGESGDKKILIDGVAR